MGGHSGYGGGMPMGGGYGGMQEEARPWAEPDWEAASVAGMGGFSGGGFRGGMGGFGGGHGGGGGGHR